MDDKTKGYKIMSKHSHTFVENYQGAGAFGWDRETDEETLNTICKNSQMIDFSKNLSPDYPSRKWKGSMT